MTFLDYPDEWRGVSRDEYEAGRLLDADDIAVWHAERDGLERPSREEQVRWWADERLPVMAEYDSREWGWWEQDDGCNVTIVGKGADDVDYPGAP